MPGDYDDLIPDQSMRADIRQRESGGRDLPPQANMNYNVQGPRHSEANSDYQIQPGTWRDWTKEFGVGQQYSLAYQAPAGVRDAVAEMAIRKYGPNSSQTWQASGPYKEQTQQQQAQKGEYDDLIPKAGAKPSAGAYDDLTPKGAQWRVPPANEGPREKINLSPQTDLPTRPTGPMDPSIAAHQSPVKSPDRSATIAKILTPMLAPYFGAEWFKKLSPDALSNALDKGTAATYNFLVDSLKQPLPGIAPKFGMTDTQANSAARDIMVELTRRGGEVAPETIKSPAIKTADGRIVEGPNHAAIREAGTVGEEGFTTTKPQSALPAPAKPAAVVSKLASHDPMDLASKGQFTSERAREIAEQSKGERVNAENDILGDRAVEWRKLTRQSEGAWNSANDARAKIADDKIAELLAAIPGAEDRLYELDTQGVDDREWRDYGNDLADIEDNRDDRLHILSREVGRLPFDKGLDNLKGSQRGSVALIKQAMQVEADHGGDPMTLLKDAFKSRAVRLGGGPDAQEIVRSDMERLQRLMNEGSHPAVAGPRFVDREQGAKIAKAVKQADPEVQSLHSENLRPQASGADVTAKVVLDGYKAVPPVPTKAIVNSIEDGGQRLRGAATNDKATWQQYVNGLPPELKDSALQEKFYEFNEDGMKFGPENKILTLPQQEMFKKFALPIIQENRDLYGELKKFNPEMFKEFDPDYVHRTVKGKTREFDPWMGEGGEANPMGGYRRRTADSAKERVYYAIENDRGQRKVVAITDHGAMVLNKGEPATPLPRYQGQATAPGDKFSINGERWSVKQAKTSEIEAHTDLKYYKNSMAGAIKNNMQLKAAVRAVNEVNRIKQTPEFDAYTVPLGKDPPKGYVIPEFPPFRTRWMDPKMAAAIDSFWTAPKMALGQRIAAINRYMLQTLFWSPLIHAGNVATHAFVARGFDWLNPMGYARLAKTFPEAVVEVVTQGEKYKEMLRDGAGLVYGSVANEAFHRKMLQGLGEQIVREPWKWDPIARVLGIGPSDLVKAIYGVSARTLWATSDAFMMQRVLELRLKGMTKLDSIAEAERHIPNYRIPSQVLNNTMVAQRLKDPSLFAFTRYDYGVFKSYAEMAKDLATGDPKTRLKAIGNVMALGFLTYYVWPYISQGLQNLTGDKDIEFGPRGALKLPMLMRDLATGGKGLGDIIPSLITMSPVVSMAIQGLSGFRDHFGRPIAEQGDWQRGRYGRVGSQVGEQIAQDMSPLYGEAAQGMEDRKTGGLRGAGERILRQGVGVRKTPKPYFGRTGAGGTYEQQSNYRQTHPRGPIEQLEKRAEQWLKQ